MKVTMNINEGKKTRTTEEPNWDEDSGGTLDWVVWQLIDPLLPTGGFAHSQVWSLPSRSQLN